LIVLELFLNRFGESFGNSNFQRRVDDLGLAMKAARKNAGLTQNELAKKMGTTQSVIARLESGEDERMPSLPFLARIASACNSALEFGFKFKRIRAREFSI
jgi:transcriptional regulator with XRE-family HTH domain